ncbi:MAG: hypothetical protein JWO12_2289, partial [Frankiales bacterium]|nr:hypothetical protein [Frankiales bacterium]
PAADGLRVVQASVSGAVWERTRALPRLRWASSVIEVPQGADSLKLASTSAAKAGAVLLASNVDHAAGARATVTPLSDGPDAVEAKVQAQGSGYLVVADGLQAGWGVTVDGARAKLLDADHALVAVAVGPGSHVVRLSYRPANLRPGLVLSALAVAGLLGLGLWRRHPREHAVRGEPEDAEG